MEYIKIETFIESDDSALRWVCKTESLRDYPIFESSNFDEVQQQMKDLLISKGIEPNECCWQTNHKIPERKLYL